MNKSRTKVRYAVVGLGHIAQVAVLPAFKTARNSELFALVSDDPEKLSKLGKKYGLEHIYSYEDYSRALSNVDAVFITLPNHLHREYAVRAAAAGVHVLCEKPMAPTAEDCLAMIHAADQNRTKLMIAYRLHFEAGNLEAIKLAESGKIGELRFFNSEFSQQVADENVRVTEPVSRGAARSTIWGFTASTPPVICSALNQSRSRHYPNRSAKRALRKWTKWSR